MKDGLWNGLGACLNAISGFIRNENNSLVGRFNLAAAVILGVFAFLLLVPGVAVTVPRIILGRPVPEWTFVLPAIAFLFVVLILFVSLLMIPRKPPV